MWNLYTLHVFVSVNLYGRLLACRSFSSKKNKNIYYIIYVPSLVDFYVFLLVVLIMIVSFKPGSTNYRNCGRGWEQLAIAWGSYSLLRSPATRVQPGGPRSMIKKKTLILQGLDCNFTFFERVFVRFDVNVMKFM